MPEQAVLTGPQERVLRILAAVEEYEYPEGSGHMRRPRINPRAVAREMWPDSPAWERRTRRYGSNHPGQVGGTMPMKAASVLWRLAEAGLAYRPGGLGDNGWEITRRGLAWLEARDAS